MKIEIDADLADRIEAIADCNGISYKDFVNGILETAVVAATPPSDEAGLIRSAPPPPTRKVSKLTFEIVTTDSWDDAGIQAIADEFARIYGGNLNIASACLVRAEEVPTRIEEDDDGQ